MEINEAGRRFFAKLKPGRLVCGTQLKLVPGSRTTLRRVIIRNRNLTRFARRYRLPITKYDGKPCVQISNPAGLWDLVIL